MDMEEVLKDIENGIPAENTDPLSGAGIIAIPTDNSKTFPINFILDDFVDNFLIYSESDILAFTSSLDESFKVAIVYALASMCFSSKPAISSRALEYLNLFRKDSDLYIRIFVAYGLRDIKALEDILTNLLSESAQNQDLELYVLKILAVSCLKFLKSI